MLRVERVEAAVTVPLRIAVLRGGVVPDVPAEDPSDGTYLAAYVDDELVGTAVALPVASPVHPDVSAVQLRGMAVTPDRQRTGAGRALLAAVVDDARARGAQVLWCNARTVAIGFYERAGFAVEGGEFVTPETGVPHVVMWRAVEPDRPTTSS